MGERCWERKTGSETDNKRQRRKRESVERQEMKRERKTISIDWREIEGARQTEGNRENKEADAGTDMQTDSARHREGVQPCAFDVPVVVLSRVSFGGVSRAQQRRSRAVTRFENHL